MCRLPRVAESRAGAPECLPSVWSRSAWSNSPPTAKCPMFGKVCAPPCATRCRWWVDRAERSDRAHFLIPPTPPQLHQPYPQALDTTRPRDRRVARSHTRTDPMYYLRPKLQQLIHWIWLPVWGVDGQVIPVWWEPAERTPAAARRKGGILEEMGDVWGASGEPGQRGCSQTVCCLWECFHLSSGAPWPQRVSKPPPPALGKHARMCCINLSCHI